MKTTIKAMALAAAAFIAPLSASAATITPGGPAHDLLADSYNFNLEVPVGAAGAVLTFDFVNSSAVAAAVTFFGWTVEQNVAKFATGVSVAFGGLFSTSVLPATTTGGNTTFMVAAGATETLTITYGAVVNTGPSNATDIAKLGFTVEAEAAAVPVPAAGLLLISALGGAAALRRRKAVAA